MGARQVTIFGGSGFIGRHVVRSLAARGDKITVAVRDPEAAQFLKPMGAVGQIVPVRVDLRDAAAVAAAVASADAVVNLVGVLFERGRQTFAALHVDGAATVARAAAAAGVGDLVHLSALGADAASPSAYARSKAAGAAAVREAFPAAVILRPSVVFGPEDDFFNKFAALTRLSPVLPVIGASPRLVCGNDACAVDLYGVGGPKFQPVYVGDVADAVVACLARADCRGREYDLGGPRVFSFKELMELVLDATGRRRLLLPVPLWAARLKARFLGLAPKPLLTVDQVRLLEHDTIVGAGVAGLADLGVEPIAAEAVVPGYLNRFRRAVAPEGPL